MLRFLSTRRMVPVVALTAAALLLAGCGGDDKPSAKATDDPTATATPAVSPDDPCEFESGGVSEDIEVTGQFGKKVTVKFDAPLEADGLQRTILDEGTGDKTENGDTVNFTSTIYNGSNGEVVASSAGEIAAQPGKVKVGDKNVQAVFAAGVSCVLEGSRVVATAKASDVLGAEGNPELGIKAEDTLVFITDVVGIEKPVKAEPWANPPKIKFNGTKAPTVTLPKDPSSRLLLGVLKKGTGAVVGLGDNVTVNYVGYNLRTGTVFDESYTSAPRSFTTDGVVTGFGAALVGQKVGAKVVVSIPPAFGYGATGSEGAGIKGTDTLLFIVEIQGTAAAPQ